VTENPQSLQIGFSEVLEQTAVCFSRRAVFGVTGLSYIWIILSTDIACRREYVSSSHVFLYKRNLICLTINRGKLRPLDYDSFTNFFLGFVGIFVIYIIYYNIQKLQNCKSRNALFPTPITFEISTGLVK